MKVVAFNCSPKMDKGNTSLILTPFLEGIRDSGGEVALFYTQKLKINPCQGCFNCWQKTPGECFQKDDMQKILSELREADIWVFASPIYHGATGPMHNLMDRTLPLFDGVIKLRSGRCRVALREGIKLSKVVLVSNCGFWEMDNFDTILTTLRVFCENLGRKFAGALLRPHGEELGLMAKSGLPVNDVFDAAREAGRQLVEVGEMSAETLAVVSRPLMPRDMYLEAEAHGYSKVLAELEK